MQHKGFAGVLLGQGFVNALIGPKLLNLGLPLGSFGPHLEAGLGQQHGVFVGFAGGFGVCHGDQRGSQ